METRLPPRVLVIGPDPSRLSAAARRLESMGFTCSQALGRSAALRGANIDGHDVVVAVEVGGNWQPIRGLIERDAQVLAVRSASGVGLSGPPVLVIAEGISPIERADALDAASSAVWDWVDAGCPDREIAARIRRLAAIRWMCSAIGDLERRCAGMETVDRLTGLPNHSAFQEVLAHEFRRAERYRSNLSLVLIDIDRFRSLNESYGHPWGDRVLQQIARDLRAMVREVDLAARYGGEEFALLLPETGPEAAMMVAGRARAAVESTAARLAGAPARAAETHPSAEAPARVTASLGVATFPDEGAATRILLVAGAESALRRAKDEGRNRVVAHRKARASAAGQEAPDWSAGPAIKVGGWSGGGPG